MGSDGDARAPESEEPREAPAAGDGNQIEPCSNWQPSAAQILAALPHPAFCKNSDGAYLSCNALFARAVGLDSAAEITGKTDFDLPRPTADAEAYEADDRAVITSGEPRYNVIEPLQLADGTLKWMDTTRVPLLDSGGRARGVLGICRDITEQKRAEDIARQERQFSEATIRAMPGIYCLLDEYGKFIQWNPNLETVTGYTASEIARMTAFGLLREDYVAPIEEKMREVLASGRSAAELVIVSKSGQQTPYYCHAARVMLDRKPHILWLGMDISDRKAAEKELERARLLLETTLEQSPVPITLASAPDQVIRYANRAATEVLGIDDEPSYIGLTLSEVAARKSWQDLRPDGTPAPIKDMPLAQALRGKTIHNQEYGAIRKDGTVRWVLANGTPVYDSNGTLMAGLLVFPDITERRRAADEIQDAAREWQATFDAVSDVVWLLDSDCRVVRCNAATERHFDRPIGEIIGKYCWEVVHGTNHPLPECPVRRMEQTKRRESLELRIEERWYNINVDPILDESGELTGAVHIISDITDRKQAEEALHSRLIAMTRPLDDASTITFSDLFDLEEIQKLQDAFSESSGTAQLITDPDGNPLTRPSGFCRLCSEFIRTSEEGRRRCAVSDASLGRVCIDGPTVRPCLSAGLWGAGASIMVGGRHIANWLIGQVRNESLDLDEIATYAKEVNADPDEFHRALLEVPVMSEEQFRRVANTLFILSRELSTKAYQNVQQARFIADFDRMEEERDRLFNLSIDMLCVGDFDGRLRQVNPAWTRALGWSAEELTGGKWIDFVHPDDVQATIAAGQRLLQGQEVRSFENRYRGKDGTYRWLSWNSYPLMEQGLIFAVCRDVTELRAAEEARAKLEAQLRQSQKMEAIGKLAGGVAHDFNNILTALFGQLDLAVHALETEFPKAQNLLDGMHQIERSAHRASVLTRQLLAFSRRQVTRPEVLNLNTTLNDFEKMLRRLLTENITLEKTLAPDLAATKMDAGQLEQVIMNLVVNARDAMPNGGHLTIETRNVVLDESYIALHPTAKAGEHVVLIVSDSGSGMDSETLEHIFEPFFTTKPRGKGTGLGLSTVYGIVRQAGGHVTAYSEPDRGTSFKVHLPAVHEQVAAKAPTAAESTPPGGTETILICEDDGAVRDLTARMLTSVGYNVLAAAHPTEALEVAAEHHGPVELLVTDVIMPDMNGRQLSEALTDVRADLRTLFVSGYTSNVIAHHGVLDEGVDFLEKPYSRRQLLVKIREILDRAPAT